MPNPWDVGSARFLVLTARSEGFLCGRPDLIETIRRLTAYSDAGAAESIVFGGKVPRVRAKVGGRREDRTRGLRIANAALSQLS